MTMIIIIRLFLLFRRHNAQGAIVGVWLTVAIPAMPFSTFHHTAKMSEQAKSTIGYLNNSWTSCCYQRCNCLMFYGTNCRYFYSSRATFLT